jgi:hypothetical protein
MLDIFSKNTKILQKSVHTEANYSLFEILRIRQKKIENDENSVFFLIGKLEANS